MLTGGTLDRQSINCNHSFIGLFPIQENDAFHPRGGPALLLQNWRTVASREGELGRESERLGGETS